MEGFLCSRRITYICWIMVLDPDAELDIWLSTSRVSHAQENNHNNMICNVLNTPLSATVEQEHEATMPVHHRLVQLKNLLSLRNPTICIQTHYLCPPHSWQVIYYTNVYIIYYRCQIVNRKQARTVIHV